MSTTAEKETTSSHTSAETTENAFLEAMKKKNGDSEEGLRTAFQVLATGPNPENILISADLLRRAIKNRDLNLTVDDVEATILYIMDKEAEGKYRGLNLTVDEVKATIPYIMDIREYQIEGKYKINCNQFIKIVKSLEEPTVADQVTKACRMLGEENRKPIVLYGDSGVGKTWMARQIARRALRQEKSCVGKTWIAREMVSRKQEKLRIGRREMARRALRQGKFDVAIWVYTNRTYEGLQLQESIAYQVSVLAKFEEWEAKEEKRKEAMAEGEETKKLTEEKNQEIDEMKKRNKIETMIREALEGKKVLLVIDDDGNRRKLALRKVDDEDGKPRLSLKLGDIDLGGILGVKSCEVLVTSKNKPSDGVGISVRPLTWQESKALVSREVDEESKEVHELAEFFIGKSKRLPSEILIIARVMSCFVKSESGLAKLRKDKEALENDVDLKVGDVLIRGYKRLPKDVLLDGYNSATPQKHFLRKGGMVNFNELISYWIIEGHLGHFGRIEDAYEEGHCVVMELIQCGLLQKQEGNNVAPTGPRFDFDILDRDKFFRKVHSGLGMTYDMKLGSITLDDGMIRTVSNNAKMSTIPPDGSEKDADHSSEKEKMSTFLLDGNHISENRLGRILFRSTSELENENLAIFNPTYQHFQLPILKMHNLRLLVLRGCRFLTSLDQAIPEVLPRSLSEHNLQRTNNQENPKVHKRSMSLPPHHISNQNPDFTPSTEPEKKLDKLTVLEISGPSSLSKIPNNLFRNAPNLKTLNMSYLNIEYLPTSFYELTKIEYLVLRGCSRLRQLESLKKLEGLQVLDVSDSTSFEKFHDKSLYKNAKLQILNLSRTKIKTLPLINSNKDLKFVSLSNCKELQRIRKIDKLEKLEIFDISGSIQVEEFCDPSLEDLESIKILDASGTSMRWLPSNVSNPRFLFAKNCLRLKRLPPIEGFTKVETIDLSRSFLLEEIRTEFFRNMKCLRELNLSKTRIKVLPSLPTLRRLSLTECEHFEKMENLSNLSELEFLDLSGCNHLKEMEDDSFEKMVRLECLNLSGTNLARLPSVSKLISLKKLYVRDCPNLTTLPGIEELPMLEILDHSGTILKPSPSFTNSSCSPRVLGANMDNIDCQQLLKTLGASGVSSGESEPLDQDLRRCKWRISNWKHETNSDAMYGIHFLHLLNNYPSLMTDGFRFLVYPIEAEGELPDKDSYRSELRLRQIYFEQVCLEKLEKCLEVRGFDSYPPFVERVRRQAQFVFLVDDLFLRSLVDLGVDSNVMGMKACWIERCDALEYVVEDAKKQDEKEKDDGKKHEEKKQDKDVKKQERKEDVANKQGEKKKDENDGNKPEEKKKEEEDANKQEEKKKVEDANEQKATMKEEGDDANKPKEKNKEEEVANKHEEKKKADDANKQEEKKKEEEHDTTKQEVKKKEDDDAHKEEEMKKKKDEANKQEEKKKEDEAHKQEDDTNKQEEKKKEEVEGNNQEETKKEDDANKPEEKKKEEGDANKQEEKKKEQDEAHKQEVMKKEDDTNKQEEKKKEEVEANNQEETKKEDDANKPEEKKKEEGDANKQEEKKKEEDEAHKQEVTKKEDDTNKQEEKKKEEVEANKQEEKKKKEDDPNKHEEKKKEEVEANKQEEKKKEDDANKQEEKKKEDDDANKQERKKKEEDDARKQEEMKKEEDANKQEENKKEEDEANKQEEKKEEEANKHEEKKKVEDDAHKHEETKKEDAKNQEEKKKEEDDANKHDETKKEEGEANKKEEKNKEEADDAPKHEETKNPADIFKNMEILWISDNKELRSILNGDIQSITFKSLKSLYLEYCPKLTTISSSSLQLENLEILYIKHCRKLNTLFTDSPQLNKLTKLHLWGLQELKSITCKAPFLRSLKVGECPLLEHVIGPAKEQEEVAGHDNLEVLHIKYCDNVKSISEEDTPNFPKLRELEMSALPHVAEVAFSAPALHCLRVSECRSLRQIKGNTSDKLKVLEVKHCEELKTVFARRGLSLGNVEKMVLLSLPKVDNVAGANFVPSRRENHVVWGCPKLCGTS